MQQITTGWEAKIWGRVWHIFASSHASCSYLEVEHGSWCSRHIHRERVNVFVSVSALLKILEWADEKEQTPKTTMLRPGEVYEVPAGVLHQFQVVGTGSLIEIYYPVPGGEVRQDDIERLDIGGRVYGSD